MTSSFTATSARYFYGGKYNTVAESGGGGSYADGEVVALTAGDFALGSFDADPGMRLWDTVQNQSAYDALADAETIPAGGVNPWQANGTISGKINNVKLDTDAGKARYTGDTKRYSVVSGTGNAGFLSEPTAMQEGHTFPGGVYLSWFLRLEAAIGGGQSTKIARFWGESAGSPNERYMSWTNDKLDALSGYGLTGFVPDATIWGNEVGTEWNFVTDAWARYEVWIDRRTAATLVERAYIDNEIIAQLTQTSITADSTAMTKAPWLETLGWDTGGGTPTFNAWSMKDIYISSYANRFELADSATWASRTHSEVQPITTFPTMQMFYGGHAASGPLYLHYIDVDNNSVGTPIQVRT